MHRASLSIPCTDRREAAVLEAAVGVEADDGPEGTSATLAVEGEMLSVEIEGHDLSGLRAAVHGILRLLDAARRTSE